MSTFARPPRPKPPRTYRRNAPQQQVGDPAIAPPAAMAAGAPTMAKPKPNIGTGTITPIATINPPKPKPMPTTSPAPGSAPATPPVETPAATPAVAPAAPTPPPTLPSAEAARNAANASYEQSMTGAHQGLYQAALRYGDPALIAQYAKLGYGPAVTDNPNSALARIGRSEAGGVKNLGDTTERNNTFFSGMHLRDLGGVHDTATRGRSAAYQSYLNEENNLNNLITKATNDLNAALGAANASEVTAAGATPPADPGAPPEAAAAGAPPAATSAPTPPSAPLVDPNTAPQPVSWGTWNSWSEDMRQRYRARHGSDWKTWRPR